MSDDCPHGIGCPCASTELHITRRPSPEASIVRIVVSCLAADPEKAGSGFSGKIMLEQKDRAG
jgi:hypothetical protein